MVKSNVLPLTGVFIASYAFSVGYNVYNAYVKSFGYPLAIAAAQQGVGLLYVVPLWILGVRKFPKVTFDDVLLLFPIALLNAGAHVCALIASFQVGGGPLTNEPVFSVILGLLMNGAVPKPFTAISILSILFGAAYSSKLGEVDIAAMSRELGTAAARMAIGSKVASALRAIMKKNLPANFRIRTNLDASNEHAITTLLSFLLILPFVYYLEGIPNLLAAYEAIPAKDEFLINAATCGMCFYFSGEIQNIILLSIGTVPTAVMKTSRRVFITITEYFIVHGGNIFKMPQIIGFGITLASCFLFAIFDSMKW